ncbi:MAG: sigma-70 family RNA polymerase sigma factor [Phycisphaerae bacterium]|nr:sigma-70 family RNA polymerase sigma factor [Phycisphaerae bacterium]
MTSKDNDVRLFEGLRRREPEALTTAVQTYGPVLIRAAWLYLADAHAAEDAVQETFLAAWDGAKRTRGLTSLRAWLLGILTNRCRKHIRTAQRRRKREQRFLEQNAALSKSNFSDPRLEKLQSALPRLDGPLREVVILRYWQKLSVQETAAALGIPEGTVKSRTHAAITRLRDIMETNA